MLGISKFFPLTKANDNVEFTAYPGEIHALLGENGAGKSTLMNILTGILRPDTGQIFINGESTVIDSPKDALAKGICMIHQHFKLVKPFTVAENVVLGMKSHKLLFRHKIERQVDQLAKEFSIKINSRAAIWQLSIGEQQRVEILKVLYRNTSILILDEPTAVLTGDEVNDLFRTLREMAIKGCTIIFITHKMHEVMKYADRITVLRNGCLVRTIKKEDTSVSELAQLMVGQQISMARRNTSKTVSDSIALEIENLTILDDKKLKAVKNLSFKIYQGEIFGIAGVSGNGQRELMEAIAGLRSSEKGKIFLNGADVTRLSPKKRIRRKLAFIPEDRYGFALIRKLTIADNASLKNYCNAKYCKHNIINYKKLEERAQQMIDELDIKTSGPKNLVQSLSGGNAQKLVLARETGENPIVLLASYPVRGLDIKATESIHMKIVDEKEKGAAILLISEDLDEIYQLCDRVAVIYEGEFMGISSIDTVSLHDLGQAMSGSAKLGEVHA